MSIRSETPQAKKHRQKQAHEAYENLKEKKPFLTEQDLKTFVLKAYSNDGYRRACTLGYRTAAEKANAKIAELEKRYNDLSGALRFKYGEWENLKAENEQLEKRLTELEKERDKEIYSFLCFMVKDFGVQKLEPFVDWLRFVKNGYTYTFEELIALFRNQKVDKQAG